jgi:DNA-binding NtrC family response regulator
VDVLPPDIRGDRGAAYHAGPAAASRSLDESLEEVERGLIERALRKARHNKARAARLLGVSRPRLHRRIKELGIEGGDGP